MTQPAATSNVFAPGPLALTGMILLAALSRLLPLPPNFAPIEAIALFGGAYFARKHLALLVPVLAMLASDLLLGAVRGGTYLAYFSNSAYLPSLLANYLSIAATVALAFGLRGRVNGTRVLGYSLGGSVLFFLISNFAVWLTAFMVPGYPACDISLASCYAAALPFFKNTLLSTLAYSAILFGGFSLLRNRVPALRVQTV